MKSITILLLHMQYGGIEKQTISLANELCKKYRVRIVSTYSMKAEPAYTVDPRVEVQYLIHDRPNRDAFVQALKGKRLWKAFCQGLKAARILYLKKKRMIGAIKKLDTDYVLSTRIEYADMLSRYAPKGVVTITQEHLHDDSPAYVDWVKKAFRNLDYLVVLSQGSGENYGKWLEENRKIRLVEIPNILEAVPAESAPLQGNRLVAVGRLHPVKDFGTLLEVFARVRKQVPDATLALLGDGEERETLVARAEELGIGDAVEFKGMLSKERVTEEMLRSDVYVMTSLTECFPMVLLEAESCGLPLVSFDVPVGPRRILEDGVNGALIPDREIDRMADAIAELLQNREKLAAFGRASKEKSYQYTAEKIMPLWDALFEK